VSTGQSEKTVPSVDALTQRIQRHLDHTLGADADTATNRAWWTATCMAVNEHVFDGLRGTHQRHRNVDTRAVNYLSLEFLMGRLLSNNLHNLGLFDVTRDALDNLGLDIEAILEEEPDMANTATPGRSVAPNRCRTCRFTVTLRSNTTTSAGLTRSGTRDC